MTRATQFLLCVVAWWGFVVLPAFLCLTGVYAVTPEHGVELEGGILWTGAWLAQVALLYVAMRVLGHTWVWLLIVACLLPWAVDAAAPYGWAWGLLWVAIAGGVASLAAFLGARSLALDEHGRVVRATVKEVLRNRINTVTNNVYITRRVLLDIPAPDGSTYEGVLKMLCEIGTSPEKGDRIRLRVDPRNPKRFALDPGHFHDD